MIKLLMQVCILALLSHHFNGNTPFPSPPNQSTLALRHRTRSCLVNADNSDCAVFPYILGRTHLKHVGKITVCTVHNNRRTDICSAMLNKTLPEYLLYVEQDWNISVFEMGIEFGGAKSCRVILNRCTCACIWNAKSIAVNTTFRHSVAHHACDSYLIPSRLAIVVHTCRIRPRSW